MLPSKAYNEVDEKFSKFRQTLNIKKKEDQVCSFWQYFCKHLCQTSIMDQGVNQFDSAKSIILQIKLKTEIGVWNDTNSGCTDNALEIIFTE